MRRVAIIGSPGTGKSTFARKLARKMDLPLVHLDYFYHDSTHDYYHDKTAWRMKANEITMAEQWIIDGNFGATMAARLQRADTIFYFDMPTYSALWGIVTRWATASRTTRFDMPEDWHEKPSWELFWKVLWFRRRYTTDIYMLLGQNQEKVVVIFKNRRQIDAYLSGYGGGTSVRTASNG